MLLLALPDAVFACVTGEARADLDAMRATEGLAAPLRAEVETLRAQFTALDEVYGDGCARCG